MYLLSLSICRYPRQSQAGVRESGHRTRANQQTRVWSRGPGGDWRADGLGLHREQIVSRSVSPGGDDRPRCASGGSRLRMVLLAANAGIHAQGKPVAESELGVHEDGWAAMDRAAGIPIHTERDAFDVRERRVFARGLVSRRSDVQ